MSRCPIWGRGFWGKKREGELNPGPPGFGRAWAAEGTTTAPLRRRAAPCGGFGAQAGGRQRIPAKNFEYFVKKKFRPKSARKCFSYKFFLGWVGGCINIQYFFFFGARAPKGRSQGGHPPNIAFQLGRAVFAHPLAIGGASPLLLEMQLFPRWPCLWIFRIILAILWPWVSQPTSPVKGAMGGAVGDHLAKVPRPLSRAACALPLLKGGLPPPVGPPPPA